MRYFNYGKKEINYLKEQDPILGRIIDEKGMIKRTVELDVFKALISTIIGQQISTKAAVTVEKRFIKLTGKITAEIVADLSIEEIQKCGITYRKAGYIKNIAKMAVDKEIDFESIHLLKDEEIISQLTKLKGVGEWTVEMLLIHSLERKDILSYKDLAIRRGIIKLYGLETLTKKDFKIYKQRYSPYGTVASIYIWEV